MQNNSKIQEKERVTKLWEGKFLFEPHYYDLTPPPPLSGPTIIKPTVDIEMLCAHRLHSSQIANFSPLLLGVDLGLPVEDLVILSEEYGKS
jgi:hypothetical protein